MDLLWRHAALGLDVVLQRGEAAGGRSAEGPSCRRALCRIAGGDRRGAGRAAPAGRDGHPQIPQGVFTYRHPLQAIASWREIFGFDLDAALQVMRDALIDMDRYRSAPGTVFVSMQEIIETVEIATTRLAAHLGLTLDKAVLDDIARRTSTERMAEIARSLTRWPEEALIDVGRSRYDPETHLHLGHITRGLARDYQATLSLEEQALCETALAEWRFAFEHWR